MIKLTDAGTKQFIGVITEDQLEDLIEILEEDSSEDHDYYVNKETLDLLADEGADPSLIDLLRQALGDRADMDIRWEES